MVPRERIHTRRPGRAVPARTRVAARSLVLAWGLPWLGPVGIDDRVAPLPSEPVTTRDLAGGDSHAYRVHLEAGDFLLVKVVPRGIDVTISLSASDGKPLLQSEGSEHPEGEEVLSIVAAGAGDHVVGVRPAKPGASAGQYVLETVGPRPATARDRERARADGLLLEGERLHREGTREAFERAVPLLEEATGLWRELEVGEREIAARTRLGEVHNALGDPARVLAVLEGVLPLARAGGDAVSEAGALNNMARAHYYLGAYRDAMPLLERALTLNRGQGDLQGEAQTLSNLASTLGALGESRRDLEIQRQALGLWRQLGNRRLEAQTLGNIGVCHVQRGELQMALDALQEALPLRREVGDRQGVAATLVNTGRAYFLLGDWKDARDYFEQALEAWRKLGNRRGEAVTLGHLGTVLEAQGDPRGALQHHRQSVDLHRAMENPAGEARSLVHLGRAHAALGEGREALAHDERALALLRPGGDQAALSQALDEMGRVRRRLGEIEAALALHREALEIRRTIGDRYGEISTLYRLAEAEAARDGLAAARPRLEDALALVESLRSQLRSQDLRASYASSVREVYELYIDVLLRFHEREPRAGHAALALHASERARARVLLDLLAESGAGIREGVDVALLDQERSLRERIQAKLERRIRLASQAHTTEEIEESAREIRALSLERSQVESRIRASSPRYAALTQPDPLGLPAIQEQVLDADTLLLEYSLGETRSALWAVTKTSLKVFTLPGRQEIETAVRLLYGVWSSGRDDLASAARLSDILLGPAASELAARRLVVVGDGALLYLPFAALPDPRFPRDRLMARHEVVAAPSASSVATLRREKAGRRAGAKGLLVLADPVFDAADERVSGRRAAGPAPGGLLRRASRDAGWAQGGIPRLPFTRREARGIFSVAPGGAARLALDFDASRAAIAGPDLADYRFVHVATHGFFNDAHPELSGILLSLVDRDGRPQDGFFSAADVFNLKLGADLVTLSGCRTGLGEEVRGEGLVGLTHAFMYAGASRVVATLWKVDDAASAELMVRFYRGMTGARPLAPAAALRAAQGSLRAQKRWEAPYYWAAFQLLGEWN
jgi:CHAT domain-containing protein/tetratricopeptide (TPR) repeat protein